jgi:FkbM family methyltransferase
VRGLRGLVGTALAHRPTRIRRGPLAGMWTMAPFSYLDSADAYEPEVTEAVSRLVAPGMVCADLGAHIGYFTLLMAKLSGLGGRVVTFEASPENARIVRWNVRLNRLGGRVTVEQAAVMGRTAEMVPIFAGRAGGSMEWTTDVEFATREEPEANERAPALEVRGIALDDYFPAGSRLDVMKIDIEGAEAHAIDGMQRVLRQARPRIVLEFHRDVGWPAIPALASAGYSFTSLAGEPLGPLTRVEDVPYQLVAEPD